MNNQGLMNTSSIKTGARRTHWRNAFAVVVVVLGLLVPTTMPVAQAGNPNPRVLPPHSRPYGKSYAEWSAKWWQWVLSIPASVNPNLDPTGEFSDQGQSGPVWFIAGNFGGDVTRSFNVPAGKALFFPIVNQEWDNYLWLDPDTNSTIEEMRAILRDSIDGAINLACEVDGVPIRGLKNVLTTRYRVESVPFAITLPPDNLYQAVGCLDCFPGTYSPAVGDGVYLMLAPLSVGEHTITFHAEVPAYGFTLTVTNHITVVPRGK